MSDVRAAVEELAAELRDERRLRTLVLYRLTLARLLTAAGDHRAAARARAEAERAEELLQAGAAHRAGLQRRLAERWQPAGGEPSLTALVEYAPPPFDHALAEHLLALRELETWAEAAPADLEGREVLHRAVSAPGTTPAIPPSLVAFLR